MNKFNFEEVPQTIQSQYSCSPRILAFTEFCEKILPHEDIKIFYDNIFNIDTAQGVGLDVWGRIIGIGRELSVADGGYFAFDGAENSGFDNDAFYYPQLTNTVIMEDNAYRQYLLITKAFANISNSTAPTINYILSQLFINKTAYILPINTMQVRYVFEFGLTPFEKAIFDLGLLPHNAGVGYEYYEIDTECTFGFNGSELESFDNGNFDEFGIKKVN